MINVIKQIRENLNLTQLELANLLNIPLKTIKNWEQNQRTPSSYIVDLIINNILSLANEKNLEEENEEQILSFVTIKDKTNEIVKSYDIEKVYLYGSYAKGEANIYSDIDLYMISNVDGLEYFGLIEKLRNSLNKKVDLLSNKTVLKGSLIEKEIKKTGILIYERR